MALVRGNIERITTDAPMDLLAHAGADRA